jgi:hypothetical protein
MLLPMLPHRITITTIMRPHTTTTIILHEALSLLSSRLLNLLRRSMIYNLCLTELRRTLAII